MEAVDTIKQALTPRRIAERVGVTVGAVYNAKEAFPAWWYPTLSEFCDEQGVECPIHAFNWSRKGAA